MNIDIEYAGGVAVITLNGRIDNHTVRAFDASMSGAVAGASSLVVDFSGVPYISSAGLRVVLLAGKFIDRKKGRFVLCGLTGRVAEVFELSGFSSILDIVSTKETAMMSAGV